MLDEIWVDINGYEGIYQVSNMGRVRSLDRFVVNTGNFINKKSFIKGRILKPSRRNKGYLGLSLSKESSQKGYLVHRLVAEAFIDNPYNYPQINHMDENKENNRMDNLEWCDCKYNINYGSWKEKQLKNITGRNAKPVAMLDDNNRIVQTYASCEEAKNKTGIHHIGDVANGKRPLAGGHKWMFV